jgi:hypothetical protein
METFYLHFIYHAAFKHESPGAPSRDREWYKSYRIIPRVGDCVLKDGKWYQVEQVFLYQPSTNGGKGIDAQVWCSYYGPDSH